MLAADLIKAGTVWTQNTPHNVSEQTAAEKFNKQTGLRQKWFDPECTTC